MLHGIQRFGALLSLPAFRHHGAVVLYSNNTMFQIHANGTYVECTDTIRLSRWCVCCLSLQKQKQKTKLLVFILVRARSSRRRIGNPFPTKPKHSPPLSFLTNRFPMFHVLLRTTSCRAACYPPSLVVRVGASNVKSRTVHTLLAFNQNIYRRHVQ